MSDGQRRNHAPPNSTRRYPTVYPTHGFGADMQNLLQRNAANTNKLMEEKKIPEMIWVMLLEASPTGTLAQTSRCSEEHQSPFSQI